MGLGKNRVVVTRYLENRNPATNSGEETRLERAPLGNRSEETPVAKKKQHQGEHAEGGSRDLGKTYVGGRREKKKLAPRRKIPGGRPQRWQARGKQKHWETEGRGNSIGFFVGVPGGWGNVPLLGGGGLRTQGKGGVCNGRCGGFCKKQGLLEHRVHHLPQLGRKEKKEGLRHVGCGPTKKKKIF